MQPILFHSKNKTNCDNILVVPGIKTPTPTNKHCYKLKLVPAFHFHWLQHVVGGRLVWNGFICNISAPHLPLPWPSFPKKPHSTDHWQKTISRTNFPFLNWSHIKLETNLEMVVNEKGLIKEWNTNIPMKVTNLNMKLFQEPLILTILISVEVFDIETMLEP